MYERGHNNTMIWTNNPGQAEEQRSKTWLPNIQISPRIFTIVVDDILQKTKARISKLNQETDEIKLRGLLRRQFGSNHRRKILHTTPAESLV